MSKRAIIFLLSAVVFLILTQFIWPPLRVEALCEEKTCLDLAFDKSDYKPGEELTGKVILFSRYPVIYPITINVAIYKDDRFVRQLRTNVGQVYPGRTEFGLKPFGLAGLNSGPASEGRWRVQLTRTTGETVLAESGFTVLSDDPGPITVPPGFHISTYALDVPNARSMALSSRGTVYVGTRTAGKVYAVIDADKDYRADRVVTIASGLTMPNGVAYDHGDLYVAEVNRVLKFQDIETRLDNPPKPVVVNDAFPKDRHHGWKYIAIGPDRWLYVPVGAPCNVCDPEDERYASIMRMRLDGTDLEVFARGVRNTVGFAWHPVSRDLWFTDNGRDWLGDDRPPDELNRVREGGEHFGFPYCHGRDISDPEFGGKKHPCAAYSPPAMELGPHVAALGMIFYTGNMFPKEYRNNILIAEHGSWNRSEPIGYRITRVTLKGDKAETYGVFAEGWRKDGKVIGRPVDILQLEDGSILVSDDHKGTIYRISYQPGSLD